MWLINSSIGRKVVMSVTGIALILFLTFHGCMNMVALFSEEGYNMICEFLGANWYAVVGQRRTVQPVATIAMRLRQRLMPARWSGLRRTCSFSVSSCWLVCCSIFGTSGTT